MKTAIYPGSFNPWHKGHTDILRKASFVFDKIIVCRMRNPEKQVKFTDRGVNLSDILLRSPCKIRIKSWDGLLVDAVKEFKCNAVIRGLRNGHDLQYEMNAQYWNEDLGLEAPIVYFITDRSLGHISSSAIRALDAFKK